MPRVEVLIDPKGEATVRYEGFKGQECYKKAEQIYQRLKKKGVTVDIQSSQPTDELYEVEGQAVTEG